MRNCSTQMIEIDRNTVYQSHGYYYKNFIALTDAEKSDVLQWRNDESVRKWMYNSSVIDMDSHLAFIQSLQQREDCYYWVVYQENEPVGVVNITNVDRVNDKAELGYYLVPGLLGEGFDFVKECFYFFFEVLKVGNFYGAVNEKNKNAILLDKFFGCNFFSKKILNQEGIKITYLVCEIYSQLEFQSKYNQNIVDYIKFVKDENRRFY